MYFAGKTPLIQIQSWIARQYTAIGDQARGYDIELRPHKQTRSNQQNRFLMAIMVAIVRFYHDTGFRPGDVSEYNMDVASLKNYWKSRWGVLHSSKLDTKNFGEFIDFIQREMVEGTGGEWEILEPDSAYIKSLIEQGGIE
jgi:hypothetical protein